MQNEKVWVSAETQEDGKKKSKFSKVKPTFFLTQAVTEESLWTRAEAKSYKLKVKEKLVKKGKKERRGVIIVFL